jgi:hypothetical protein
MTWDPDLDVYAGGKVCLTSRARRLPVLVGWQNSRTLVSD